MRRLFLSIIYLSLFLLGPGRFLEALEIELSGGINNLAFDSTEIAQIQQFEGFPYIFGDFSLKNDITDVLGFDIHFSRDPILQYNMNGKIIINTNYFNMEFGTFFGMDEFLKPDFGILGGLELVFPGIFSLSVDGSTSMGIKNEVLGNNNRETAGARLGFWLPNLHPALSAKIKAYTREEENSLIIRDELIRLMLSADIFAKNSPVIVRIDAGYDILSRSYENGNFYGIKSETVFAGFEIKWQIIRQLRLSAGFEMPVYIIEPAVNPPGIFSLFKAYSGFVFTFF